MGFGISSSVIVGLNHDAVGVVNVLSVVMFLLDDMTPSGSVAAEDEAFELR